MYFSLPVLAEKAALVGKLGQLPRRQHSAEGADAAVPIEEHAEDELLQEAEKKRTMRSGPRTTATDAGLHSGAQQPSANGRAPSCPSTDVGDMKIVSRRQARRASEGCKPCANDDDVRVLVHARYARERRRT